MLVALVVCQLFCADVTDQVKSPIVAAWSAAQSHAKTELSNRRMELAAYIARAKAGVDRELPAARRGIVDPSTSDADGETSGGRVVFKSAKSKTAAIKRLTDAKAALAKMPAKVDDLDAVEAVFKSIKASDVRVNEPDASFFVGEQGMVEVASVREALPGKQSSLSSQAIAQYLPSLALDRKPDMVGGLSGFKVQQVIDGHNCIISVEGRQRVTMWLTNFPTKNFEDGATYTSPSVFFVKGSRTYETVVGGSKTLFEIEPIDAAAIVKAHIEAMK